MHVRSMCIFYLGILLILLRTCFVAYVHTKVIKRMGVRPSMNFKQRTLLLPLSLGVSSLTLLHVLTDHLQGQMVKSGRVGYSLHVLHVETSGEENVSALDRVKERYSQYTYSTIPLSNVLDHADVEEVVCGTDSDFQDLHSGLSKPERMDRLLGSLSSATAKADILQIFLIKLIVAFGKTIGSDGILWGDSTTKLAEKTLAETAKGRGFSLPWVTTEGESPHGLNFYYPMRDLLKKELSVFADMTEPPLAPLVVQQATKIAVSAKNNTIDGLMTQYFESVEENYPSIVANVVRTTDKLQAPLLVPGDTFCSLCNLPCGGINTEAVTGPTDSAGTPADVSHQLCRGCARDLNHPI